MKLERVLFSILASATSFALKARSILRDMVVSFMVGEITSHDYRLSSTTGIFTRLTESRV
jgi:hypothetical protein